MEGNLGNIISLLIISTSARPRLTVTPMKVISVLKREMRSRQIHCVSVNVHIGRDVMGSSVILEYALSFHVCSRAISLGLYFTDFTDLGGR
jgi:hypothetical protein